MLSGHLNRVGRALSYLYVAGLAVPLFIFPGYGTTNLTLIFRPAAEVFRDSQALRIHWVVVLAGLVGGFFLVRWFLERRIEVPGRIVPIACLLATFAVALVAGLFVRPSWLNVVYFVQSTIPLVGFLVGGYLAGSTAGIRRICFVLIGASTFSIVCILVLAYSFGALSTDITAANRLARAVPQSRDYFPFIAVSSLSLTLAVFQFSQTTRQKALVGAAITAHLVFYTIVWSRMAFLMLAVVVAARLVLMGWYGWQGAWRRRIVLAIALIGGATLLFTQVGIFKARREGGELQRSDSRRIAYLLEGASLVAENPIFGRMFIADWTRDPHPERDLRIPRIYKVHNQYLDYGIRAGLPALLVLLWIMWIIARDLRTSLRSSAGSPERQSLAIGISAALLAVVVGNLTQLFLVQAQTGSLAWLLAGTAASMARLPSDQKECTAIDDGPEGAGDNALMESR